MIQLVIGGAPILIHGLAVFRIYAIDRYGRAGTNGHAMAASDAEIFDPGNGNRHPGRTVDQFPGANIGTDSILVANFMIDDNGLH
jgi:hypothetical protein